MSIIFKDLKYKKNDLEPYSSEETIKYHYDCHHNNYVNKLNNIIKNTIYDEMSLLEIINDVTASDVIINNAGQIWNHDFYWNCLIPKKDFISIHGNIKHIITNTFGSLEIFKQKFKESAMNNFGSGWTWLIKNKDNELSIYNTKNGNVPYMDSIIPLLVIDIWEHAYYIDYRNRRDEYINNYFELINWKFVEYRYTNINIK
jgi:Fe-Mn family superoxide dismutase